MNYNLNSNEKNTLRKALLAAFSIPFIDDIEDFIWESIFSYVKGIDLIDPMEHIRKKLLFDIVEKKNSIGWSAKAIQWTIREEIEFEIVIQRADIFKKKEILGFNSINLDSNPEVLGEAVLKHWNTKIIDDSKLQNVTDKREVILLKSKERKKYAYFETSINLFSSNELTWHWSDSKKNGLQGIRKIDNFIAFRWYPNQKQLFERHRLPKDSFIFDLNPKRLNLEEIIENLLFLLHKN